MYSDFTCLLKNTEQRTRTITVAYRPNVSLKDDTRSEDFYRLVGIQSAVDVSKDDILR